MHVVACAAPAERLDPAPAPALPPTAFGGTTESVDAFWAGDAYLVRARERDGAQRWFRIEAEPAESVAAPPAGVTALLAPRGEASLTPLFPVGSTGRTVFRVWCRRDGAQRGRTRILGVRAARSRRLPA